MCRSDHSATTVLVSATAVPDSSVRKWRSFSAGPRWYRRLTSGFHRGRDTIAATSLRSRTKLRLITMTRVWSTPLLRMEGNSSREHRKPDHMVGLKR